MEFHKNYGPHNYLYIYIYNTYIKNPYEKNPVGGALRNRALVVKHLYPTVFIICEVNKNYDSILHVYDKVSLQ